MEEGIIRKFVRIVFVEKVKTPNNEYVKGFIEYLGWESNPHDIAITGF